MCFWKTNQLQASQENRKRFPYFGSNGDTGDKGDKGKKPPTPPPDGSEEITRLKTDLAKFNSDNETLRKQVRALGGTAGRVRKALNMEDGATDAEITEAILRLSKKPPESDGEKGGKKKGEFTEDDLNAARAEGRQSAEESWAEEKKQALAETEMWKGKWMGDRVTTTMTRLCTAHDPVLDPDIVMSMLRDPQSPLPFRVLADPEGEGVLVVDKTDPTKPYFDQKEAKTFQSPDALAMIAKSKPGAVLVPPASGTGAGRGERGSPAPTRQKAAEDMSPTEKISGAFVSK